MKIPRLKHDRNVDEGRVVFPPEWHEVDNLMRADLLQDWLCELAYAYRQAIFDLMNEMDAHGMTYTDDEPDALTVANNIDFSRYGRLPDDYAGRATITLDIPETKPLSNP